MNPLYTKHMHIYWFLTYYPSHSDTCHSTGSTQESMKISTII